MVRCLQEREICTWRSAKTLVMEAVPLNERCTVSVFQHSRTFVSSAGSTKSSNRSCNVAMPNIARRILRRFLRQISSHNRAYVKLAEEREASDSVE